MNTDTDQKYFWIAKEGLKESLPHPWKPCKTKDDDIYYFNFETGESTWEHPMDGFYEQKFISLKAKDDQFTKKMI